MVVETWKWNPISRESWWSRGEKSRFSTVQFQIFRPSERETIDKFYTGECVWKKIELPLKRLWDYDGDDNMMHIIEGTSLFTIKTISFPDVPNKLNIHECLIFTSWISHAIFSFISLFYLYILKKKDTTFYTFDSHFWSSGQDVRHFEEAYHICSGNIFPKQLASLTVQKYLLTDHLDWWQGPKLGRLIRNNTYKKVINILLLFSITCTSMLICY